jgi:hypothetical protein
MGDKGGRVIPLSLAGYAGAELFSGILFAVFFYFFFIFLFRLFSYPMQI